MTKCKCFVAEVWCCDYIKYIKQQQKYMTNLSSVHCTLESRNFWANSASSKQQFPEKYVVIPWESGVRTTNISHTCLRKGEMTLIATACFYLLPQSKLFLLVLQGIERLGAVVPQRLHLTGVLLEGLTLPDQGLELFLCVWEIHSGNDHVILTSLTTLSSAGIASHT